MTKTQKYLESLKHSEAWVTVLEWAEKVSELYPEILEDANKQVQSHATETTGLRAITARLSSKLSANTFINVEIDDSERPRKVRYVEQVVALQMTIASRLEIELVDEVLDSLFEKLEKIY